jgi:glycosyltransferase involved in cell wall biosynthesis
VFAQEDDYEDQEPFIFRYPSLPLPTAADIPAAIPISPNIDWLLAELKLDVIHTHHPVLLGQTAAKKAKKLDLPFIFTFHTKYHEYTHYFPIPQEAVQEFLKEAVHDWLQNFMRTCHHIVVPSESMLTSILEDYGLQSQYTVVPTGIDLAPFRAADGTDLRRKLGLENSIVMISVGRLGKEKNWKFLLQGLAQAMSQQPKLRYILVGGGPERRNLEEYSQSLGICDKVTFTGHIPFEQIPTHLKAADFFGFASTTESQGLVTLEALAAGLPVVAVDASGTCDIVEHGAQGLLVEEDTGAFAQAINQMISDQELYQNFIQQTSLRAQQFDISIQAQRLLDVYRQAAEDKQAGRYVQVQELDN